MYVYRNIRARSRNHYCRAKAISIKYYSVYLYPCLCYPACTAHAPYCIVFGLPGCTVFFTLSPKRYDLRKTFVEHKICFYIFSATFV
jgi:hypothetical protein